MVENLILKKLLYVRGGGGGVDHPHTHQAVFGLEGAWKGFGVVELLQWRFIGLLIRAENQW